MTLLKSIQHHLAQLRKESTYILALSGGLDSVALAHILKNFNYNLVLAHFNHGWRGKESDADEQFVRNLAKAWKLALEVGRGKKVQKGNAEDQARKDRYAFLEQVRQKHKADYIVLAHHRDDQIETILMHQKRGAGLRGMAGMPFQRGHILRPLLDVSKADLIDYAKVHQLEWREDSSNQNLGFTRNRLRHGEIPQLKAQDLEFEKKLLEQSRKARQKLQRLEQETKRWIQSHLKDDVFDQRTFLGLKEDLQAEILLQLLGPADIYRPTLTRLKRWIEQGQSGTRLTVKGQTFWREHDSIYIEKSRKSSGRRDWGVSPALNTLTLITKTGLQWGQWHIQNFSNMPLFVRSWQPGDRFHPSGMKGSKKVQDFFVDAKIPKHLRHQLPLIINEKNDIISISSLRFSQSGESLKTKLKIVHEKFKNPNIEHASARLHGQHLRSEH